MLKMSLIVAIALGISACDNNYKADLDRHQIEFDRERAKNAEAKAACRRNMGSCSLSETCSIGLQFRDAPDRSREVQNCETQWNAATSRERGAAYCEQFTSKMLYDECVRDLR